MINKQNLWFLTLFCLILVLSVYYVTMPSELLLTNATGNKDSEKTVTVKESEILTSLRVERDAKMQDELADLRFILTNLESSIQDKNEAFDKMKKLNRNRGEEEKLETKIKEKLNFKSFIKIDGDQIRVVVDSKEHDEKMANNIMRLIQEEYKEKKYISVKFQG
ncbi:MAG: SpoIIIAH-like family protein [Firmicutes bacterium]|nr:SpoIIIAH-like family protein [Bacillota bacterium]